MRDGWEVMADDNPPRPRRAVKFMAAMIADKPADAEVTTSYRGKSRCLMMYGPGATTRLPVIREHLARGGRVAMWDLGYWDRETSMRLAVDTFHPTAEQLKATPAGARREFVLREDAKPEGHIVLVGLGPKSNIAWGLGPLEWERKKLAEMRSRFPGREVLWRPKNGIHQPLDGLMMEADAPIRAVLKGASLVVSRHSNVSVDAVVAGVPFEAEDGAAANYFKGREYTRAERAEFLRRLSFWEWSRNDAPAAWDFLHGVTSG